MICARFRIFKYLLGYLPEKYSDGSGLTESLFTSHKDEYLEYEQASLRQLYKVKVCNCFKFYPFQIGFGWQSFIWVSAMQMEEFRAESQQISDSSGTIGRSKGASVASSQQQISVTVVTEFVRWNEEAISRCNLFSSQVITCFCDCILEVIFLPTSSFVKPHHSSHLG